MWIESHQSLRNHPKIKKAARLADINEFEMIGRIHCLWWWALDYAPDGEVTKYSSDDIESAVDWNGTPGSFYNALLQCGFNGHCGLLEDIDGSIFIHDWQEYGGRLLERREINKERMRVKRASHVQSTTIARTPTTEQTEQTEQNRTDTTHKHAEKSPRKRDPLFDAIAEVCRIDPATAGSSIAKVESALKKADPPYTDLEVRAFGVKWWEWKARTDPPTIWKLKEQIGTVRRNGKIAGKSEKEIDWLT